MGKAFRRRRSVAALLDGHGQSRRSAETAGDGNDLRALVRLAGVGGYLVFKADASGGLDSQGDGGLPVTCGYVGVVGLPMVSEVVPRSPSRPGGCHTGQGLVNYRTVWWWVTLVRVVRQLTRP